MPNLPQPTLIVGLGGTGALSTVLLKEQLLNIYNREVPKTVGLLVFDTDKDPIKRYNFPRGWTLTPREFGVLGMADGHAESAKPWIKNIAQSGKNEDMQYLNSWLQADWYLKNVPDNILVFDKGAGQFRQIGRLALFKDVVNEGGSSLYRRLVDTLNGIRNASREANSLNVYLVCSVTGGTGAGTFLDVAYLIRKISREANFDVTLRVMIVLPQAFDKTLDNNQKAPAQMRSFAAIRELNRFVMNKDWGEGYPMFYHDPNNTQNRSIWHNKLTSKLFDFVYLIDGIRPRHSLNEYEVRMGIGPTLCDTLLALMDSNAGPFLNSQLQDSVFRTAQAPVRIPFVGSLGTYSVILPIQQIIDQWAYQLAYDTVKLLTAPDETQVDPSTRTPKAIRSDANQELQIKVVDGVSQLLSSRNKIFDIDKPEEFRQPTGLLPELYRLYTNYQSTEAAYTRRLQANTMDEWLKLLQPDGNATDSQTKQALQRVAKEKDRTMATEIMPSDKKEPREDYVSGAKRARREADDLLDRQIGLVRSNGGRSGGEFHSVAETCRKLQFDVFCDVMALYLKGQLNGQDEASPVKSRAGKLGWTLALLSEFDYTFNEVYNLLIKVREGDASRTSKRAQVLASYDATADLMKNKATDTGNPIAGNPARKAQQAFIVAADELLNVYRGEVIRDELITTVRMMRDYVRGAMNSLNEWAQTLLLDAHGLYATALVGIDQVRTLRMNVEKVESRWVINDDQWEDNRYQYYSSSAKAQDTAMRAFRWTVTPAQDLNGNRSVQIGLTMGEYSKPQTLTIDRKVQGWSEANLSLLLKFCRQVFTPARESESVVAYLRGKLPAADLARELIDHTGVLLGHSSVGASGRGISPTFSNILLAYREGGSADQLYLDDILNVLRADKGVAATNVVLFRELNCDDRFRLTVVNFAEDLPVHEMDSIVANRSVYLQSPLEMRRLAHIFPAEVNICEYEERLETDLRQQKRAMQDQICLLVEDRKRFVEFLTLLAYGVIIMDIDEIEREKSNRDWRVFYLLAPNVRDPKKLDEWWLTKPEPEPSMLDAMMTYIYIRRDIGREVHNQTMYETIDDERVLAYLRRKQRKEAKDRFFALHIGGLYPEFYGWFEALTGIAQLTPDSPEFKTALEDAYTNKNVQDFALAAIEAEVLHELADGLRDELNSVEIRLKPFDRGGSVNRPEEQKLKELKDLYSLSIMVLMDESKTKYTSAAQYAGKTNNISNNPLVKPKDNLPKDTRRVNSLND